MKKRRGGHTEKERSKRRDVDRERRGERQKRVG